MKPPPPTRPAVPGRTAQPSQTRVMAPPPTRFAPATAPTGKPAQAKVAGNRSPSLPPTANVAQAWLLHDIGSRVGGYVGSWAGDTGKRAGTWLGGKIGSAGDVAVGAAALYAAGTAYAAGAGVGAMVSAAAPNVARYVASGVGYYAAEYIGGRYVGSRSGAPFAIAAVSFNFEGKPGHMSVAFERDGKMVECFGIGTAGVPKEPKNLLRMAVGKGRKQNAHIRNELTKLKGRSKRPAYKEVHPCTEAEYKRARAQVDADMALGDRELLYFNTLGLHGGYSCASWVVHIMKTGGQYPGSWVSRQLVAEPKEMTSFTQEKVVLEK